MRPSGLQTLVFNQEHLKCFNNQLEVIKVINFDLDRFFYFCCPLFARSFYIFLFAILCSSVLDDYTFHICSLFFGIHSIVLTFHSRWFTLAHQSVFSRPQEARNKAVPMPQNSFAAPPLPPQQTSVNAIPKAPMPSGSSFKATPPKAPSFTTNSTSNANKPSAGPTGHLSFKPSSAPQPAASPQVTTARVPSQKAALPIDPSRTPHCSSCNQDIR